jgi:hypothetical protein
MSTSFDMIPHLLADLLEEQRRTNDAIAALAKSLAIAVDAQRYREQKAIVAEPPVEAVVEAPEAPASTSDEVFKEAAEAIKSLGRKSGVKAAEAVLSEFGAKRLGEVPSDRIPEVLGRIREAQAA